MTDKDVIQEPVEFSIYGPMISASGDAAGRKYKLLAGKSGKRWVVADQDEAAENVYVDGGPGSDGMAGRTLTFDLVDGTQVSFIGPWKTGADALFRDTGYDVRGSYYCQCLIATGRACGATFYSPDVYTGIIHFDPAPVLNNPVTIESLPRMAQEAANTRGVSVYYAWKTKSGGCRSAEVKPEVKP